jgi:hypothetical protein
MWHDSVMQVALRFGRELEFIRRSSSPTRRCSVRIPPSSSRGDMVKMDSVGERQAAEAVADLRDSFTTADVRKRLVGEPNSRSVRRQLAALVEAG